MKKILMIGTGGTIASEMTPEGLTPELSTHQLLAYLPRIAQLCHVDCIQLCSLDSTSIHPAHWLGTAQAIREHYDDYDGFVISHGTDTMAYTAAALSYLVQDSPKPIILTGAQKPIWFDGTDSKRNLTDAFLYACRGCGGVQIVFNGRVILGTRARKTYSKSFRAFSSVNYPDLAVVQDEHLLQYIRCDSRPRPLFYDRLDPHVGLLKLIPGTEDALAEFMLDAANRELERNVKGFDREAQKRLKAYPWPGNIRELRTVVRRATLLAKDGWITATEIGLPGKDRQPEVYSLNDERAERATILKALGATGNDKKAAARLLGISRSTLYLKLKKYRLD